MLREAYTWRSGNSSMQYFDDCAGIAADVAAIGQDLPLELAFQPRRRGFDVARLTGDAERGGAECDRGQHARHAAMGLACGVAQITDLTHETAQKAPIEAHVGILQHERRLTEP